LDNQRFGNSSFWVLVKSQVRCKIWSSWRRYLLQLVSLAFIKVAQQSVQWIGGIRRHFQAFFWLRAFSALKHFPSPPANH